ncbi:hypothetical protein Patl1_03384 [Pistacia atlantica]|uniref:Uncharacterized protein n=1 Tax=Pistacia atlantica TaxID=434234 RepID=A0ACC1C7A1_9ROSI|nr:hypothetical protein Patl1_03384 [Pistacia atlantica]
MHDVMEYSQPHCEARQKVSFNVDFAPGQPRNPLAEDLKHEKDNEESHAPSESPNAPGPSAGWTCPFFNAEWIGTKVAGWTCPFFNTEWIGTEVTGWNKILVKDTLVLKYNPSQHSMMIIGHKVYEIMPNEISNCALQFWLGQDHTRQVGQPLLHLRHS